MLFASRLAGCPGRHWQPAAARRLDVRPAASDVPNVRGLQDSYVVLSMHITSPVHASVMLNS